MANVFGQLFRIATWGESHGGAVGVVVDGCPPGLPISVEEIQAELDRRRPGQSDITTPRKETDTVEILSGIYEGHTLGSPIGMNVRNKDARPSAYEEMKQKSMSMVGIQATPRLAYENNSQKERSESTLSIAIDSVLGEYNRRAVYPLFELISERFVLYSMIRIRFY